MLLVLLLLLRNLELMGELLRLRDMELLWSRLLKLWLLLRLLLLLRLWLWLWLWLRLRRLRRRGPLR